MSNTNVNRKKKGKLRVPVLGPVVRKPINANPQFKVNQGFHLARQECL